MIFAGISFRSIQVTSLLQQLNSTNASFQLIFVGTNFRNICKI